MAEEINNAFAQQPETLDSPVPTQSLAEKLRSAVGQAADQTQANAMGDAGAQQVEPDVAPTSLSSKLQQAVQGITQSGPEQPMPVDEVPSEPLEERGFFAEQFVPRNIEARIRASFGETPEQKVNMLKKWLGPDRARITGKDSIEFRPQGKDKFIKLEPETFDLIGDIFVDNFREIIADTGGAAAVAAQGPAALEPVSSAAAFGLGVAATDMMLSSAVEDFYGAKREDGTGGDGFDEDRLTRGLTKGALAATFKRTGDFVSNVIAKRSASKKAIEKLEAVPEWEILGKQVDETMQMFDDLGKVGIVKNIPGGDLPVTVDQLAPYSPAVQKVVNGINDSGKLDKAKVIAASNWKDTMTHLLSSNTGVAKSKIDDVIESGVRTTNRAGIQKQVKNLLRKSRKAEGQVIGKFRMKAGQRASKEPAPVNEVLKVFDDMVQGEGGLGIKILPSGKVIFPETDDLAGRLGTDSPMIIKGFKKQIQKIANSMEPGSDGAMGIKIDKMTELLEPLSSKIDNAHKFGKNYARFMGKLGSALRADRRQGMKTLLDPEDAISYSSAIKSFEETAKAQTNLRSLLNEDTMATQTFVKSLLSQSKKGMGQFEAAREFLLKESPETWNNIMDEFVENLILKNRTGSGLVKFSPKGVREDFSKLGSEYLKDLMPEGNPKQLFHALDMGDKLENAIQHLSNDEVQEILSTTASAISPFRQGKVNALAHFFRLYDDDGRVLKLINKNGMEDILEKFPKEKRGAVSSVLGFHLNAARKMGIISEVNPSVMQRLKFNTVSGFPAVLSATGIEGITRPQRDNFVEQNPMPGPGQ